MLVYLGGTCSGSVWREKLTAYLLPEISVYNPVETIREYNFSDNSEIKSQADYILYVLTPETQGFLSVARAVDLSNKHPEKLLFCYLESFGEVRFNSHNLGSMQAISNMILENGGRVFTSLEGIAQFLNAEAKNK